MTRKELSRYYWRYYRMLEDKFLSTVNYVEISQANKSTYSNEYALLLQSIGAELDNFFKVYCGFNLTDRKNIADYATFVLTDFPAIITTQIQVLDTDMTVTPFDGWNTNIPAQSLSWWLAFDHIKHNRVGNFQEANQENVLNILAALYILEVKMFTKATKDDPAQGLAEVDIPSEDSKVFALPLWKFRCISAVDLREIEKWR